MREQIRLWFYSQLFMSVTLTGRAPYRKVLGYEKMLDERGREMHGSWGNTISAEEAFARMGADVMRWQYCQQPPNQNLLFGFGPGKEIQRKLLTLWNSVSFFASYANTSGFTPIHRPTWTRQAAGRAIPWPGMQPLDRWLLARTARLIADATRGYEQYLTVNVLRAFESYLDDLSNWYIRRSRRRFWNGDEAALRTLWTGAGPGDPGDLADHRRSSPSTCGSRWSWRSVRTRQSRSSWRAGQRPGQVDDELVASVGRGAQGRRPRPQGQGAGQAQDSPAAADARRRGRRRDRGPPRRRSPTNCGSSRSAQERIETTGLRVRPNFRAVAPRLGASMPLVKKALDAGEFRELDGGRFEVHGLRPRAGRGVRRAAGEGRLGRCRATTASRWRWTRRSTTSCAARAGSTS